MSTPSGGDSVTRMDATQRDAGLLRAVGPWTLASSIICNTVGAGIFAVPGALAASVGPYAPWALLLCAFGVGAVAICFAEGGSHLKGIRQQPGLYGRPRTVCPRRVRRKQEHRQVAQFLAQAKGDLFRTTHGGAGTRAPRICRPTRG